MSSHLESLMEGVLKTVGRVAIPEEKVLKILAASPKHFGAYNLCDGTKLQTEIAKEAGLDSGNFSRSVDRWVLSGILFRIGKGKSAKLLHLYPVAKSDTPKKKTR